MTRVEAIDIARRLSEENNPFSVLFDRDRKDFFISEGDYFVKENDFYGTQPYEIIAVFR